MLTADQVTELRGKLMHANRQRAEKPFVLVRCIDGPLAGLEVHFGATAHRTEAAPSCVICRLCLMIKAFEKATLNSGP